MRLVVKWVCFVLLFGGSGGSGGSSGSDGSGGSDGSDGSGAKKLIVLSGIW